MPQQSSWFWMVFTFSLCIPVAWIVKEIIERDKTCIRCHMSIMVPEYTDLSQFVKSSFSFKYRTFRYTDVRFKKISKGECIPVLFVPGSVGSYRQVRSLGSAILDKGDTKCYEIYAVDFRQEFVAFSPSLLREQAKYVNDSLGYIKSLSDANEIVLVGHSFGGIVLRLAAALADFEYRNLKVLAVTVATPHLNPPIYTDPGFKILYEGLKSSSENFRIISLCSGRNDILVPPQLCMNSSEDLFMQCKVNQLTLTWSDPHHQGMIWERQIMDYLSNLIIDRSETSLEPYYISRSEEYLDCDYISNYKDTRHDIGICHKGGTHCVIKSVSGEFDIFASEDLNYNGMSIHSGDSYKVGKNGMLNIGNPQPVHLKRVSNPGRSTKVRTTLNSVAEFTEIRSRLSGTFSGLLFFHFDCQKRMLAGFDEEKWSKYVDDFPSICQEQLEQAQIVVKDGPFLMALNSIINLGSQFTLMRILLFGMEFPVDSKIELQGRIETPMTFKLYTRNHACSAEVVDLNGASAFSWMKNDLHYFNIDRDSRSINISSEEDSGTIRIRLAFLDSLVDYLVSNLNWAFKIIFVITLCYAEGLHIKHSAGIVGILAFSQSMYDILLRILICIPLVILFSVYPLTKKGPAMKMSVFIPSVMIIITPISLFIKMPIFLTWLLVQDCRVGTSNFLFCVVIFLGTLLKSIFDIRNLFVLVNEISLEKVLQNTLIFNWFTSYEEIEILLVMFIWNFKLRSRSNDYLFVISLLTVLMMEGEHFMLCNNSNIFLKITAIQYAIQ